MHDTGGWYIETFGRDKKGRKILSPRQWDGSNEHSERCAQIVYNVVLLSSGKDLVTFLENAHLSGYYIASALLHLVAEKANFLKFAICLVLKLKYCLSLFVYVICCCRCNSAVYLFI
jgi:hypothetical protein